MRTRLLTVAKRRLGSIGAARGVCNPLGAPRGTRVPRASCAAWRGMIRRASA